MIWKRIPTVVRQKRRAFFGSIVFTEKCMNEWMNEWIKKETQWKGLLQCRRRGEGKWVRCVVFGDHNDKQGARGTPRNEDYHHGTIVSCVNDVFFFSLLLLIIHDTMYGFNSPFPTGNGFFFSFPRLWMRDFNNYFSLIRLCIRYFNLYPTGNGVFFFDTTGNGVFPLTRIGMGASTS